MTVGTVRPSFARPASPAEANRPHLAEAAGLGSGYSDVSSLTLKRGLVAGAAIGSAYGTVVGAVAGSLGAIGGLGYAGARFGAGVLGLPGLIGGGILGLAAGVAEEKYLHAGATVGGLAGMGVGAIVGGAIGAVVGIFV